MPRRHHHVRKMASGAENVVYNLDAGKALFEAAERDDLASVAKAGGLATASYPC